LRARGRDPVKVMRFAGAAVRGGLFR